MQPWQMNPYIRYMDRRTCSISYKTEIMAYEYRLFADIEGSCQLMIDGQTLTLNKDSLVIFPPAMPYRFIFSEQNPAGLYDINFNLNFVYTSGMPLGPDPVDEFKREKMPEGPDEELFARPVLIEQAADICHDVGMLLNERERHGAYGDELCAALLKGILLRVFRKIGMGGEEQPSLEGQIMRYLEEHCRETISLEQLGKKFGYHPVYLNRMFREQTGKTLHKYQMECRMQRACVMLRSTRLSIKEIAGSTGFSSPAYFSELFVKMLGVTPGQYRSAGK